jgi:hypothetical protein
MKKTSSSTLKNITRVYGSVAGKELGENQSIEEINPST